MLGFKPQRSEHNTHPNCHFFVENREFFFSPEGDNMQRASSRLDLGTVLIGFHSLRGKLNGVFSNWQLSIRGSDILGAEVQGWWSSSWRLLGTQHCAEYFFFHKLEIMVEGMSSSSKSYGNYVSTKKPHWNNVAGTHDLLCHPLPKCVLGALLKLPCDMHKCHVWSCLGYALTDWALTWAVLLS